MEGTEQVMLLSALEKGENHVHLSPLIPIHLLFALPSNPPEQSTFNVLSHGAGAGQGPGDSGPSCTVPSVVPS